jgi:hypothetical protein
MATYNRTTLFWGILLILAGTVFLLNNLNVIPGDVLAWWPLPVLGAGLWLLGQAIARRGREGIVGGIVLTALGAYWLLANLGLLGEGLFLPVLLIALGAGLLLRGLMPA